jgi:hypothetical protein
VRIPAFAIRDSATMLVAGTRRMRRRAGSNTTGFKDRQDVIPVRRLAGRISRWTCSGVIHRHQRFYWKITRSLR